MKLSWHDAHFMLMPKKTCETFCANWISRRLAGVDPPAPLDAEAEPFRLGRRTDQLGDEPVVGLVLEQRLVEPPRDLLPAAVDIAGPPVVVPEQVVPEASASGRRSRGDRRAAAGRAPRACPGPDPGGRPSSSSAVGSSPTQSRKTRRTNARVVERRRRADFLTRPVRVQDPVDRLLASRPGPAAASAAGASAARHSRHS